MDIPLQVKNLNISFYQGKNKLQAVHSLSFDIHSCETVGLVGESGCGKSITSLAIMGLLPQSTSCIEGEGIFFEHKNIMNASFNELLNIRGSQMSMIFQDPMTSLNPVYTIGNQVSEVLIRHKKISRKEAYDETVKMFEKVRIPTPAQRFHDFPHQLSGGMRQRVMIAMALACRPKVLIADEPTTALDVTIQAQVLALMNELQEQEKTSILFITHDLGVVSETCDKVLVMYAGHLVEKASTKELFENPLHPYTKALLKSIPTMEGSSEHLYSIPGLVPKLGQIKKGCKFASRCEFAKSICFEEDPVQTKMEGIHEVWCHLYL